jgi:hypothetical protein
MSAVVKNTKYLLENYSSLKDLLDVDIEYNYKHFLKIIEEQNCILDRIEHDLGVQRSEIDYLLDGVGFDHLVRKKDE